MCEDPACDFGWIHIQHPCKGPGVIVSSIPCPKCNPEGKIPAASYSVVAVSYKVKEKAKGK